MKRAKICPSLILTHSNNGGLRQREIGLKHFNITKMT